MKRSVVNDPRLGELPSSQAKRDAVHVAVISVEAGELLHPGDRVSVLDGKAFSADDPVGIVDPFLLDIVEKGRSFWLLLMPGSVTSLRHAWTHPALPDEGQQPVSEVEASKAWLMNYAAENDIGYTSLIEAMRYGDSLRFGRDIVGESSPSDLAWHHAQVVIGTNFEPEHREKVYFSCSC